MAAFHPAEPMRRLFALMFVLALAACGGGTARSVEGVWQASGLAPGAALTLGLNQEQGRVAGSGDFTRVDGGSGRLIVTGMQSGPQVQLAWTYDSGERFDFTGSLQDDDHLSGTLTMIAPAGAAPQPLAFARQ